MSGSGDVAGWHRPSVLPPEALWRTDEAIRCLECGRWMRSLGRHLARHAMTAETYRAAWGMARSQPLTCGQVSSVRSDIAVRTGGPDRLRHWAPLVIGDAHEASRATRETDGVRPAAAERRKEAARRAWAEKIAQQERAARDRLAAAGHDPDTWLMAQHRAGVSMRGLARELDLSPPRIRDWLTRLGVGHLAPGPRPRG